MQLIKICFHAFKSLLGVELKVNNNCIGFVGINESGKSNVLAAIHILGGEHKLTRADTPKMAREDPFITYTFELNDDEFSFLQTKCNDLFKPFIPEFNGNIITQKTVNYNIVFDRQEEKEIRYFDISELNIDEKLMIVQPNKLVNGYQVKTNNGFKDIKNCWIISDNDFSLHLELEQKIEKLTELNDMLAQKEDEYNKISNKEFTGNQDDELSSSDEVEDVEKNESNYLVNLKNEIVNLKNNIKVISGEIKDYKVFDLIKEVEKKSVNYELSIKNELANKSTLNEELKKLKVLENKTADQIEKITEIEGQIKKIENVIFENKNKIDLNTNTLFLLKETISEKYSNEKKPFVDFILDGIDDTLNGYLPKVVFWEYDERYLQKSKINLIELLEQKDLNDLPRPLINIFRICFGIKTLEDIKIKVKEAQGDGNERNRISDQLTDSVNEYLKKIWANYDQRIKITIEENELRVAIFDPVKKHASYYSLVERSQGCRTFISFLLTIGAEANKGVLENTILLLDEPETHLHPSGVKFMLQELIKIADKKNNKVFFATHSMFMIDRKNFSRHIIVKKEKEKTKLEYAVSGRIGSFLQEEVLYNALEIEFDEFDSTGKINFVFEGYGDTIIFESVYKSLSKNSLPFSLDECFFHHGGGCDRIKKYFSNKQLKIETKWLFILDSDAIAENLKKFIESKFVDYLNKDVFVFQYRCDNITNIELEDLLPEEIKIDTYNELLSSKGIEDKITMTDYLSFIATHSSFSEQFDQICDKYGISDDGTKGIFKEKLNNILEKDIAKIDNAENLKKRYSNYYEWFEAILDEWKKGIKQKKKDNDKQ